MNKRALRVTTLFFALVISLSFASAVAKACDDVVTSENFFCELTGEDERYCYYLCECSAGISEVKCANILGLAGFELI
jgi:hypothetical protein